MKVAVFVRTGRGAISEAAAEAGRLHAAVEAFATSVEVFIDARDDGRGEPGAALRCLMDEAGRFDAVVVTNLTSLGLDLARVQDVHRALAAAGTSLVFERDLRGPAALREAG